ncbi:MAG: helix-turn-helix domain-containing protein [Roseovarius sp.]|nr:helix-turn-helix domain-containing protein [Roseovarius sp.]
MQHAEIKTLVQWARGSDWRSTLQHSCPAHALIWITRGQGISVVDGVRRGVGVHNALAIPAGTMFSLDLGKTGFGLVCLVPAGGPILMPDMAQHLRIRDVTSQNELTAILEAMQREQSAARPFMDEALNAQASLLTVWLRRAMIDYGSPDKPGATERLMRGYASLIERDFTSGRPMAVYARALGVTPTHLSRVCRQASGLTAADMLTERNLHATRDLLEDGDMPIGQVAATLGFGSAAYFSRFVLQHTGLSPSALRARATERGARTQTA